MKNACDNGMLEHGNTINGTKNTDNKTCHIINALLLH